MDSECITYRVVHIYLITGFGFPLADGWPVFHADLKLSDVFLHGCSERTPHKKGHRQDQHARFHGVRCPLD